jgi:hypothetical protein
MFMIYLCFFVSWIIAIPPAHRVELIGIAVIYLGVAGVDKLLIEVLAIQVADCNPSPYVEV